MLVGEIGGRTRAGWAKAMQYICQRTLYLITRRGAPVSPSRKSTELSGADKTTTVASTHHEASMLMMPHHENVLGHVFGGVVLSMIDTTAAVSAMRHARTPCVTVSVDRVDFREPIHIGELLTMKSSVNYVGTTSMEVGVRVETENLLTGERRHTNSCYLTFVAIDKNGKPAKVPQIRTETLDEERRYAAARERRRRRLEERNAEGKREG